MLDWHLPLRAVQPPERRGPAHHAQPDGGPVRLRALHPHRRQVHHADAEAAGNSRVARRHSRGQELLPPVSPGKRHCLHHRHAVAGDCLQAGEGESSPQIDFSVALRRRPGADAVWGRRVRGGKRLQSSQGNHARGPPAVPGQPPGEGAEADRSGQRLRRHRRRPRPGA